MKRRRFIKYISIAGGSAAILSGIPINALARNNALKAMAAASNNDNVLILIQMHGGNNALNTLIPYNQYDKYYDLRSNIALPKTGNRSIIQLDNTLPLDKQAALHPEMQGIKDMYDNGKVAFVNNVSYDNMNLLHFRGRDILFMGIDSDENNTSPGWMGRYLLNQVEQADLKYPDYHIDNPNADPLGLEFGGSQSLAFHNDTTIPMSFNIQSPEAFYSLINGLDLENLSSPIIDGLDPSHAKDELIYLTDFDLN